jgi:hypothetical protein
VYTLIKELGRLHYYKVRPERTKYYYVLHINNGYSGSGYPKVEDEKTIKWLQSIDNEIYHDDEYVY